jgi:hypothetical protein
MPHADYVVKQLLLSDKRGWALDSNNVLYTYPAFLWDAGQVARQKGHSVLPFRIAVEEGPTPSTIIQCLYVPTASWVGVTFWARKAEWLKAQSRDQAVEQALAHLQSVKLEEAAVTA